ncbi:MAG: hypothetical protein AVDCRST_MAG04-2353, partial [uncultured Acetobacteraceae bacterium]
RIVHRHHDAVGRRDAGALQRREQPSADGGERHAASGRRRHRRARRQRSARRRRGPPTVRAQSFRGRARSARHAPLRHGVRSGAGPSRAGLLEFRAAARPLPGQHRRPVHHRARVPVQVRGAGQPGVRGPALPQRARPRGRGGRHGLVDGHTQPRLGRPERRGAGLLGSRGARRQGDGGGLPAV